MRQLLNNKKSESRLLRMIMLAISAVFMLAVVASSLAEQQSGQHVFHENFEDYSGGTDVYWEEYISGGSIYDTGGSTSASSGLTGITLEGNTITDHDALITTVDLSRFNESQDIKLTFSGKQSGATTRSCSAGAMTKADIDDCIAITCDGVDFYSVFQHGGQLTTSFQEFEVDIDAAVSSRCAGKNINSSFAIAFGHQNNDASELIYFDDIYLTADSDKQGNRWLAPHYPDDNNNGLEAYLQMEASRNSTGAAANIRIEDESGNNNYASNSGSATPSLVPGIVGGAAHFDGTNDYLSVGSNNEFDPDASDRTWMTWVKVDGSTGGTQIMISFSGGSGWSQSGFAYLYVNSGNVPYFTVRDTNGNQSTVAGTALDYGKWYHVAGTWDTSTHTAELFVDGVSQGTATQPLFSTIDTQTLGPLSLGYYDYGGGDRYYLNGSLDEVMLFDRILTPQEIQNIVNFTKNGHYVWSNADLGVSTQYQGYYDQPKQIVNWYKDDVSLTVLNLPFEGVSSTTATSDYSGYDQTVTASTVTWDADGGVDGWGAYDFNSNYLSVTDDASLDIAGSLSVEAWVYADLLSSSAGRWNSIVTKGTTGDGGGVDHNYLLGHCYNALGGYGFCFTIENSAGSNCGAEVGTTSASVASIGRWHHVVGVFDDDANSIQIYVNGVQVDNDGCSLTPNTNARPVRIGYDEHSSAIAWRGDIDEVKIYDYALTPEQIAKNYEMRGSWNTIVKEEIEDGDVWKAEISYGTIGSDNETGEGSACTVPYDGITISEDTTFCPGTYNLNDSDGNGLIYFGADDVTLTCNNTILQSQGGSSIGIYEFGNDRFTVDGCTFNGYLSNIYTFGSDDCIYLNSNFINSTDSSVYITSSKNMTMRNVTLSATNYPIYLQSSSEGYNLTNITIQDGLYGIRLLSGSGRIIDSVFLDNAYGINILGVSNLLVHNNTFINNTQYAIYQDQGGNSNFTFNTVKSELISNGIYINGSSTGNAGDYNIFQNNNFTTTQRQLDRGIHFYSACENNLVDNNSFYNIDYAAIQLEGQSGSLVQNNNFTNNIFDDLDLVAFYFQQYANNNLVQGNTILGDMYDTLYCMFFNVNSADNNFTNNTFYQCGDGLRINSATVTGNMFFYNNFTGNQDHVEITALPVPPNHWNTTVNGEAQGNYWDDISTIKIFDSDNSGDGYGWGDYGSEYPYNDTPANLLLEGVGIADVQDYGPMLPLNDNYGDLTCIEPIDNLTIMKDRVICPGVYNITDNYAGLSTIGILLAGAADISIRCAGTTISGPGRATLYDATAGIFLNTYNSVNVTGCNITNYTNGIWSRSGSSDHLIYNNTLVGDLIGIRLGGSSSGVNVSSNVLNDNNFSIFVNSATNNYVEYNNITETSHPDHIGVLLYESSTGNFVYGNNILNAGIGLYVSNDTTDGNTFYWNNLTGSIQAHAYSVAGADNEWNTTVGGEAQGNYWDDSYLLRIFDSDTSGDGDGWGDYGTQYPYSAATGGNVTGSDILDYGPMGPFYDGCLEPGDNVFLYDNVTLCSGTYELVDSGSSGILIYSANNINVTCNNTVMIGDNSGWGINVGFYDDAAVKHCDIRNFTQAIRASYADYSLIYNNTLLNNTYGVYAYRGHHTNVTANYIYSDVSDSYGIYQTGTASDFGNNNLYDHNFINVSSRGIIIDSYCANNTIYTNNISRADYGIYLYTDTNNSNVTANRILDAATYSIRTYQSKNNVITNNYFDGGTSITNDCLRLSSTSTGNNLTNNTFYNCLSGLFIENTDTDDNYIYWNNFTGGTTHATATAGSDNHWNTTGVSGAEGNYWDDSVLLKIFDSNDDNWGDYGTEHPYSATYSSKVIGTDIQDYGPMGPFYDGCVEPYVGMVITDNTTLCSGTYYLNATSPAASIITLNSDDINLTCNGTTIIGNSTGYGLSSNRDRVVFKNCELVNYTRGINLESSSNSLIYNNTVSYASYAIYLNTVDHLQVMDNDLSSFTTRGISPAGTSYSNITGNTLNKGDVGTNPYGIYFYCALGDNGDYNRIEDNTINGTYYALYLRRHCIDNIVSRNVINNSFYGIWLRGQDSGERCYGNNVTDNNLTISGAGLYIYEYTNDNLLETNYVERYTGTAYGVLLQGTSVENNTFRNNTFDTLHYGISVSTATATGNLFYYNNFTGSLVDHVNAIVGSDNEWNTTGVGGAEGNYWDDSVNLRIFDVDSDNWGDYGTEYPYSATNGGNVVGSDVLDYGPMGPFYSSCIEPADNLHITEDTTLCSGTYEVSDAGDTGVLIFDGGYDLDCNGAILNGTDTGTAIYATGKSGVSIHDCVLANYSSGVQLQSCSDANVTDISSNGLTYFTLNLDSVTNSNFSYIDLDGDTESLGIVHLVGTSTGNVMEHLYAEDLDTGSTAFGMDFYGDDVEKNRVYNFTVSSTGPEMGVRVYDADNNSFENISILGVYDFGFYFRDDAYYNNLTDFYIGGSELHLDDFTSGATPPSYNRIINGTIFSESTYAIRLDSATANYFEGILVDGDAYDSDACVYLENSPEDNIFVNNTFYQCLRGVYIISSSAQNNSFYWNNFTDSFTYHAQSPAGADNNWNTSVDCPGVDCHAEGNYWDDVSTLDLIDSQTPGESGFGWADTGTQYPYNATWGHVIGDDIQDYGPYGGAGCYDNDGDGAYNTSSDVSCDGYRDCDDSDADVFPPYLGLTISSDTTLCGGTFYLNTTTGNSVVEVTSSDVNLICAGTILIGNDEGYGISVDSDARLNITGCSVSNYSTGIYIRISSDSYAANLSVWDNSNYGLAVHSSADNYVKNVTSWDNGVSGVLIQSSSRTNFSNSTVRDNNAGIHVFVSDDVNMWDVNVTTNTDYGINAQYADNFNLTTSYMSGNLYGLQIRDSLSGIITNNTFLSNTYGINVYDINANYSKIYWNNFSSSVTAHVRSLAGAINYWNTSVNCPGVNCHAEGNYWDDIASLDIWDADLPGTSGYGWADDGTDYPYSSANGGDVLGADVQDYGPFVEKHCYDTDGDGAYNTSSDPSCPGTYRDCDDTDADLLPPRDDLSITSDKTLCPGTYYINDSGADGIIVPASSTNISCAGTTIIGNTSGYGVYSYRKNNVVLHGCVIQNYSTGIYLGAWNAGEGDNVIIYNNTLINNSDGLITYYLNAISKYLQIYNNSFFGNSNGIDVNHFMYNSTIRDNYIEDGSIGIYLSSSGGRAPKYNNITNNTLIRAYIFIAYARENLIDQNYVDGASRGLSIASDAYYNVVRNNTFRNCTLSGIYTSGVGPLLNLIYWNNFTNNTLHAQSNAGSINRWNTSVCDGTCHGQGNYWDDISTIKIFDSDSSGIGYGWGDYGSEYPYRAAVSSLISDSEIVDYGPMLPPGDNYEDVYGCKEPYDDMNITSDTTLCSGTYEINDSGSTGIINMSVSNLILDCNGSIIIGNNSGTGIYAYSKNRLNISNCNLQNYTRGIHSEYTTNSVVFNNTILNSQYALFYYRGGSSNITYNHFDSNASPSSSGVYSTGGPGLSQGKFNRIEHNYVRGHYTGITLSYYSYNNTVAHNSINETSIGIFLGGTDIASASKNNTLRLNNVTSANRHGIKIEYASENNITINRIDGQLSTDEGLYFEEDSDYNVITNNTIFGMTRYGINISTSDSDNNLIYWNSFSNNALAHAVAVAGADNHWNTTICDPTCHAEGNYWDDISSLEIYDANSDGWGDDGPDYPYNETAGNVTGADIVDWGPMGGVACYDDDGDGAYNTSSDASCPGYRDCDDNDASLVPPRDELLLTSDTTLCSGTYYVNDSGSNGLVRMDGDGVDVDCNGTILVGDGNGYAFFAFNKRYSTVSDCIVKNYTNGIYLYNGNYSEVRNNTVLNVSNYGIFLRGMSESNVTDNYLATDNPVASTAIYIWGGDYDYSGRSNIISRNYVNDPSRRFSQGVVLYVRVNNNTVFNNTIVGTNYGIYLWGRDSNNLYSNISENTITSAATEAIFLRESDNNTIVSNTVSGEGASDSCLYAWNASNNVITNNTFDSCEVGVEIYDQYSDYNNIYWNNFINSSTSHATAVTGSINHWNTTVCNPTCHAQGNYWDDSETLEIFDTDRNYWGDYGDAYPYNESNGGDVSGADITDWGPYTPPSQPSTVILRPLSNSALTGSEVVEAISGDDTVVVEFYLQNATGTYAFDGTAGSTNDTFGTDGWTKNITTSAFAEGNYTLVAKSYFSDSGTITFQSQDTETNLSIIRSAPAGSITIYGENGTTMTNTRNVLLNLSYSDAVGVDSCRYANDLSTNLALMPWEDCTMAKSWILSDGYGNKTVYYQIKNTGGVTVTYNDSIVFQYVPDYTAPGAPIVYDGLSGADIDWWNSNNTLHAHWLNATEDMSTIYYRYRIWENSSLYAGGTGAGAFTSVGTETSVTVTGLTLLEGTSYYFEVEAYNSGNLSSNATSDGVVIDLTAPGTPVINSTSHPDQNTTYGIATALLNWSVTDPTSGGNASGIEGYSYLIDRKRTTIPDEEIEDYTEEIIQAMPAVSDADNIMLSADTSSARGGFSQGTGNLTVGDKIKVRVKLFEYDYETNDELSYMIYIVKKSTSAVAGDFSFNDQSGLISNVAYKSDDIIYATSRRSSDYEVELTINDTLAAEDWYVAVFPNISDSDNTNDHYGAATTQNIDETTNLFICVNGVGCLDQTLNYEVSMEITKLNYANETQYVLPDGTHYFHLRAKDNAGNWGLPAHYKINIGGTGIAVDILSPGSGEVFVSNESATNVTVEVLVSDNASVYVVAENPDGSNSTSTSVGLNSTNGYAYNFTVELETGDNVIYAVADTPYGARVISDSITVELATEVRPQTNQTLRIQYGGTADYSNTNVAYDDEGSAYVGIGTETTSAFASFTTMADTATNTLKIFMTGTTLGSRISDVEADFADDSFLDRKNPSFGYEIPDTTSQIMSELRFRDINLDGSFTLPPGKYNLYLRKSGVDASGRYNVSLVIR